MTRYSAAWIVPIVSPPIQNGWVEIDKQFVTSLGGPNDEPCKPTTRQVYLDEAIILPSLIIVTLSHVFSISLKICEDIIIVVP